MLRRARTGIRSACRGGDRIAARSKEADAAVLRIMTSGDDAAVTVLFNLAYRSRDALGNAWWRLLVLALLRSGLSILAPDMATKKISSLAGNAGCGGFARGEFPALRRPFNY